MARGDWVSRRNRGDTASPGGASEALPAMVAAEVEQQLDIAQRRPRDIERAAEDIRAMATLDVGSALEMLFARKIDGKVVRGPSIRLAEVTAHGWGNCRATARTVYVGRDHLEVEGVFHDLQTNTLTVIPVRRWTRRPDGSRAPHETVFSVASQIARRNAILSGVPRPVWRGAVAAVEEMILGAGAAGDQFAAVLDVLGALGIDDERARLAVGAVGGDVDRDGLLALHGFAAALRNGEAEPEDLFPTPEEEAARSHAAVEGFSPGFAAAETGVPLPEPQLQPVDVTPPSDVDGASEPALPREPDAGGAAPSLPQDDGAPNPSGQPQGELAAWADLFDEQVASSHPLERFEGLIESCQDTLGRLFTDDPARALATRARIVARRRALEAPDAPSEPPLPRRDQTVDLFAGVAA